jgi:2-methylisocitrate lyase-like PEP mutase family enzyme
MDHTHDLDALAPSRTLDLALAADHLRALHVAGDPLVLVNAWDVASAREVVAAGARAVGTSSAAVAAGFGAPDDNTMAPGLAFGAVERIASAVPVPVTADVEAGYDLHDHELVAALLGAGAVGCNLEDSDHRRPGELVDAGAMAVRLAGVRAAARDAGVGVVVNARIDVLLHHGDDRPAALAEVVRRARRYVEAGADCVFPVGVGDPATAGRLVDELGVPVNVGLAPGVTVAQMAAAGVSRISFGPTFQRRAMADLRERAGELLAPVAGPSAAGPRGPGGSGGGDGGPGSPG